MTKRFDLLRTPRTSVCALVLLLLTFSLCQPLPNAWARLAFLFAPPALAQVQISSSTPGTIRVVNGSTQKLPPRNIGIFFNKMRAGKAVTVAYLGGSLTAADSNKTAFRTQVTNWLRQNFKDAQINELNAGVAGTGVSYGVMRVRRDVIAYKPDLVFIEFAVPEGNDAPEAEEGVKKALEGMLRQMLIVPSPPQIVVLHTTNPKRVARIEWFDAIAAHYQVPTLNLQAEVWKQIEAGTLKANLLWPNPTGLFTSDEGHKAYANLITTFLEEQAKLAPSPLLKVLPNPLVSDEMNYGELKAIAEFKHDPAWRNEANNDRALPSQLLSSDRANAQVDIYFEGSVVGLSYRVGPDGGTFECLIDGKPAPAPLNRIDAYDTTAHIQTRLIPGGLGMNEHKLTIRVLGEKNPKSSGNAVRLGSLLVGGQRPERL